ncbi:MAG: alpha/beta hydrolase-fold protein [Anaerolineae bacterium]
MSTQSQPEPQPVRPFPPPTPNDTIESPVVEGRAITLCVYAPHASEVALRGDLVEGPPRKGFARDEQGIWSLTLTDVVPGTYRYQFLVDEVTTPDPRNPVVSPTHTTVMSLVRVSAPETAFEDAQEVPHGAVASVYYRSPVFGGHRRMHVYTPPGYERSEKSYPVLYLLHGGGDSDASWSTIGRAGFILDNLIAAGEALPMLVVMPAGHAPGPRLAFPGSPAMTADPANDPFTADLLEGVTPGIEALYRVQVTPEARAIAGLSMGGVQAANIGIIHAGHFRYLGIFSSGWFPEVRAEFEERQAVAMRKAASTYRLVWTAWGNTDIARPNSLAMLELFDRHGIRYMSKETEGGHTWINWRHYLAEFAPLLFR